MVAACIRSPGGDGAPVMTTSTARATDGSGKITRDAVLAAALEITPIAEGVEEPHQRGAISALGCQFGQGYLLSVPVDADAASAMLRRGRGLVTELPRQPRRSQDGRYLTDL